MVHCPVVVMCPHPAIWFGSPSFQLEYFTSSLPNHVKLRPWADMIKQAGLLDCKKNKVKEVEWEVSEFVGLRHSYREKSRLTGAGCWWAASGRPAGMDPSRLLASRSKIHRGRERQSSQGASAQPDTSLLPDPQAPTGRREWGPEPEAGFDLKSDMTIRKCLLTHPQRTSFLVVADHRTWLLLADESIVLQRRHLTGSGSPHPSFPLWVAVNDHDTVSLRQRWDVRTATKRRQRHNLNRDNWEYRRLVVMGAAVVDWLSWRPVGVAEQASFGPPEVTFGVWGQTHPEVSADIL